MSEEHVCNCPLAKSVFCEKHQILKSRRDVEICQNVNVKDRVRQAWLAKWSNNASPVISTSQVSAAKHTRSLVANLTVADMPCTYRGEILRQEQCTVCGSKGKVTDIYACGLPSNSKKECTLTKRIHGTQSCQTCVHGREGFIRSLVGPQPTQQRKAQFTSSEGDIEFPEYRYPELCREPLDTLNSIRHLAFYLMPVAGDNDWIWRKHVKMLKERDGIFNGRRRIAIVTPGKDTALSLAPFQEVVDEFGDFNAEFMGVKNNKLRREGAALIDLFDPFITSNPNEVVCFAHGKGCTHKDRSSVCHRWSDLMYASVVDNYEKALDALQTHVLAGSFRRSGSFRTKRNHRWHYSGTFYWFRSASVAVRDWKRVDPAFFGSESWPGVHFKKSESHCLFYDNAPDLYRADWDRIEQEWKQQIEK